MLMKKVKTSIARALLGILLAPALLLAQGRDQSRIFVEKYDLDATTTTYCVTSDQVLQGPGLATTNGSSTTVTSLGSTGSFDGVAAGDTLYFRLASGVITRYITAKASANSITIDTATTLSADASVGVAFSYRNRSCGTAATSGWMNVPDYGFKTIVLQIDQLVVTGGISVKWQCKAKGDQAVAVDVYPGTTGGCPGGTLSSGFCNYTAVTAFALIVEEPWDQCRVGMKIGTNDDGDDLTTNAENINIYFLGTKSQRP
jgi:hypothetical protein